MGGEQAAFARLLPGSRSLHSQVCRVCRFCAMSDFFFFIISSFSSALRRERQKRRREADAQISAGRTDAPNKVLRNK